MIPEIGEYKPPLRKSGKTKNRGSGDEFRRKKRRMG
jgi:hypothetical protein